IMPSSFYFIHSRPPPSTLFPYTTLFRSDHRPAHNDLTLEVIERGDGLVVDLQYRVDLFEARTVERMGEHLEVLLRGMVEEPWRGDRKSTRLNSSHSQISYAVFCLKKKKK